MGEASLLAPEARREGGVVGLEFSEVAEESSFLLCARAPACCCVTGDIHGRLRHQTALMEIA